MVTVSPTARYRTLSFVILTFLFPAGPFAWASSDDSPVAELSGRWQHDQGRSDQHYMGPEYPGRWMELQVRPGEIEIEQALGGVRDGFPTPGSGDTTAQYVLPTDGEPHEIALGKLVRDTSATWREGVLHVDFELSLGDQGSLRVHEAWQLIDQDQSLEIQRTVHHQGREKTRRLFFRRKN